ncbi:glutamyl-tRNA amidotransferase [Metamycoplasma spumans]|uniref:glutamyl-tRNA amidotransferase n=1 Tax=Metamycoplasma spumans TaxID=92406 RepID=UPI00048244FD
MQETELKKLAKNLLFDPNPEVLELAKNMLISIDKKLDDLENFNLDNYKAQSHINEKPIDFSMLRKDEVDTSFNIKKQDLLNNAANRNDDYVVMRKVINDK